MCNMEQHGVCWAQMRSDVLKDYLDVGCKPILGERDIQSAVCVRMCVCVCVCLCIRKSLLD